MNSQGDDHTAKAKTELEHAIASYLKEADDHEKKAKEYLHLAGIEQGKADGLKKQADGARQQLGQIK